MSGFVASSREVPWLPALTLILMTIGVSLAGSRDNVTPFPADWPHRVPYKLNRELLTPQNEQILFVVEIVRGLPAKESALDHLVLTAARYGRRQATWVYADAPEAPDVRWVVPEEPDENSGITIHLPPEQSLESWRISPDLADTVRHFSETIDCPSGPLPNDTSFVFVRYLGRFGAYGAADTIRSTDRCGGREFPVIYVAQDVLSQFQMPGFGRAFLEPRDLVHEYGHLLGLGSNPAHALIRNTLPDTVGSHCVVRRCAVAIPSVMALVNGRMLDYCDECRKDIAQAREHWKSGAEFPEVSRLEVQTAAEFVADLKKYSFARGAQAESVVRFGKQALPPLMKRIPQLPGTRDPSPRQFAVLLVKRILVLEDRKRRGAGEELRYGSPRGDRTDALLDWWGKQRDAFMNGDDWTLPADVLITLPADG